MAIFIDINEGPQWFVSKLIIRGRLRTISPALLLLSALHRGQPYSDLDIATDRDNVLDYYFNNGYPAAKFDFTSMPAAASRTTSISHLSSRPATRVYVRNVVVDGPEAHPAGRGDAAASACIAGDPLSQSEINGSQRRLYDLGIFSRVDAAIQNPDGDEPTKYVLYSIEEAGRYSMNVGVGAEIGRIGGGTTSLDSPAGTTGFSPRFSFGVSRLNFLGLGHTVELANAGLHAGAARSAHLCRAAIPGQSQTEPSVFRIVRHLARHPHLLLAPRGRLRAIGAEIVAKPTRSNTATPIAT